MELGERYRLEGGVETVIFHSGQTGFTVARAFGRRRAGHRGRGVRGIAVGETLIVEGVYATHPKYGLQLKADKYERLLPATAAAIASYLSSGAIKGIGPKTAGRAGRAVWGRDAHRDRTESGKAHEVSRD